MYLWRHFSAVARSIRHSHFSVVARSIRNSIKNGCKNLYLNPKLLQTTFKLNSYLMSISRCGPVTPSIPFFPSINLTKTIKNFFVVLKITEKSLFSSLCPWWELRTIPLSDVTLPLRPGKFVNPNFWQYQPDRSNDEFDCCLEIKSKRTARNSAFTLNLLKLPSNQTHIWRHFLAVTL